LQFLKINLKFSQVAAEVACFDTAFHHDLPRVVRGLPIPHCYFAAFSALAKKRRIQP